MPTITAFHGKETLKKDMIAEIRKHQKQDQIVQGTYGQENGKWRGCAVGCSIHSFNLRCGKKYETGDHSVYQKELGIPEELAYLEDDLFEAMNVEEAKKWPLRFMKSIPLNADLSAVFPKWMIFVMNDNRPFIEKEKLVKGVAAIDVFIPLLEKKAAGEHITTEEWERAYQAAEGAEEEAWARAGARAGAWAGDLESEYQKIIMKYADELIRLLEEAPVVR